MVLRGHEWGPYYTVGTLNGVAVYIRFGVKFWSDGVVSLVIGD